MISFYNHINHLIDASGYIFQIALALFMGWVAFTSFTYFFSDKKSRIFVSFMGLALMYWTFYGLDSLYDLVKLL